MYRTQTEAAPLLVVVSSASVEALDRRTGRVVWSHVLAAANQRSAVCPRVLVEDELVILLSAGDLPTGMFSNATVPGIVTCLDYRTGRVRWEQRFDDRTVITQFTGTLLVDAGQVVVALPTLVFAYSMADGTPQWRHEIAGAVVSRSTALALPGTAAQGDRTD